MIIESVFIFRQENNLFFLYWFSSFVKYQLTYCGGPSRNMSFYPSLVVHSIEKIANVVYMHDNSRSSDFKVFSPILLYCSAHHAPVMVQISGEIIC